MSPRRPSFRDQAAWWRPAFALLLAFAVTVGCVGTAAAASGPPRGAVGGLLVDLETETPAPLCEAEAPSQAAAEELAQITGEEVAPAEEPCPPTHAAEVEGEAAGNGAGETPTGAAGEASEGGKPAEEPDGPGPDDEPQEPSAGGPPAAQKAGVVENEDLGTDTTADAVGKGTPVGKKDASNPPGEALPGSADTTSEGFVAPDGLLGAGTLTLGQVELPPLLLPVYQACGSEYEIPWQVLAAINKIESGFGANMGPSSAGAIGPMQFMPATWATDGLDANGDGQKDALDPFDAVCAAARYLHESGGEEHLYEAIFAYNHAGWYVEEVLREARNFGALPANLLASLTALAEGETAPVPAATDSTYAAPIGSVLKSAPTWLAATPLAPTAKDEGPEASDSLAIEAPAGSPVLAVADSTVLHRGRSEALGRYLILRDAYGTRYTYSHLGPVHRVAKESSQVRPAARPDSTGGRRRLSAFPARHGATEPATVHTTTTAFQNVPIRKGTKVGAGTVIAAVSSDAKVDFALQPDGSGSIDPQAFVSAWRHGGAGGIFAAPSSSRAARKAKPDPAETLLLGAAALRRRALHDPLLDLPRCERGRLRAGRMAPRAVAALEFLVARRGKRVVVAPQSCGGHEGFGVAVASVGGYPLSRHGQATPLGRALTRQARSLQGSMAPQRIITVGGTSAAEALITSAPAGSAGRPDTSPLELDFSPPQSATLLDGRAVAPVDAPPQVQAMIAAANQISETPYIWGGGHGDWVSAGYDCSGSVSYVLHAAELLGTPETSGVLADFGEAGAGRWVTIYANATHTYAEIAGLRWDTVGDAAGSGPRWHLDPPYPEGFAVRHPEGL